MDSNIVELKQWLHEKGKVSRALELLEIYEKYHLLAQKEARRIKKLKYYTRAEKALLDFGRKHYDI